MNIEYEIVQIKELINDLERKINLISKVLIKIYPESNELRYI